MKTLRPLLFFVSMLLIVGLACSFGGGGNDTPTAQPQPPTQAPQPTAVPPTEAAPEPTVEATTEPTEAPVSEAQDFFTEEFDEPLSNDWSRLTVTGSDDSDTDKVTVEVCLLQCDD